MKRHLLTTTALVTAGVLASTVAHAEEGIKLGLGGYMNNYLGFGDADSDGNDFAETTMYSDGEVWFTGETTLDNGLTFGANVQLESFRSGDQIDENFGYMEGGFGRLQFGSENTASYLMQYSAPNVGAPINSGWVTVFIPQPGGHSAGFRTPGLSTYIDIGNDENTLTYFTPRLFGFQVGVSYQAAVVFTGEGLNNPADPDTQYHHGFAVGVNFVESFGGVDVALAGGYRRAEAPDNGTITAINPTGIATTNGVGTKVFTIDVPDMQQVSGGINIGFAGVTIGGSVAAEIDGRVTATTTAFNTTTHAGFGAGLPGPFPANTFAAATNTFTSGANSTEGWSWDAGISYGTGPWTFGAAYIHGEVEGSVTNGDQDTLDAFQAGVEYAVGPGITASLTGMYADWQEEGGGDNAGYVGIAGVSFGF
jgi:hypothetical protein